MRAKYIAAAVAILVPIMCTLSDAQTQSADADNPAFCAGYLAGYCAYMETLKMPDAADIYRKRAFWFASQAEKLNGKDKKDNMQSKLGLAKIQEDFRPVIANPTDAAMRVVLRQFMQCDRKVQELLPETKACFEWSGTEYGFSRDCLPANGICGAE